METFKKILESTSFKLGVAVMGAIFTAVRLGGLAFPQYLQFGAVVGMVLSGLYLLALAYQELLSRLLLLGDDRSKISESLDDIREKLGLLNETITTVNAHSELVNRINSVQEKLGQLHESITVLDARTEMTQSQMLTDEALYQSLAQKYGYANELVEIECVIERDGSTRVERQVRVRAFAKYDEIDTYLMVPEMLDANAEQIPEILRAESINENRKVTIKDVKKELGRLTAVINFFPPLIEGVDSTYRIVERTPPATFALEWTEDEMRRRVKAGDPDEYFGWNINRPTRQLSIRVFFPEGYRPQEPRSQVRFATAFGFPSIQIQTEEQHRVEMPRLEPATGGQHILDFQVKYPMTNLIYMLRWLPQLKTPS